MVAAILSRVVIVVAGILYPAYSSFKAVKGRSHREYTQWMMYWIVFALFQAVELVTDTFIPWMPLYYELKIIIVLWLVLPLTQGSKQLYRVLIHPFLVRNETKIDEYVQHFVEKVMSALRKVSRRWLNLAASTVVLSAIKGQEVLTETLLNAQQDQAQDGGEGGEGGEVEGGGGGSGGNQTGNHHYPSTSSRPSTSSHPPSSHPSTSSHCSEDFEVIEEEPEITEGVPGNEPPLTPPPLVMESPTVRDHTHSPEDGSGLYHRT